MTALNPKQLRALARLGTHLATSWTQAGRLPYKVEFLLTSRCDSRCKTCGAWARPTRPEQELSRAQIVAAAESLSTQLLWLGLSGGEPTLRQDFGDIAADIADRCKKLVLINFGTNGLNPVRIETRVRKLAQVDVPFIVAALSIDGIGEVHDRCRGVDGAFDKLLDTAGRLIELERRFPHFSVSFQTTVSALNHDRVHEIPAFLARHFPGHVYMATVATNSFLVGRDAELPLQWDARLTEALRKLVKQAPVGSPFDLIPQAYLGLAPQFVNSGKSPVNCMAGRDMIIVDARGDVRPCDYVAEPIGRLVDFNGDLRALLEDRAVRARIDALKHCHDCFTPCQAFPSLVRQPLKFAKGLIKSRM